MNINSNKKAIGHTESLKLQASLVYIPCDPLSNVLSQVILLFYHINDQIMLRDNNILYPRELFVGDTFYLLFFYLKNMV